MGLKMKSFHASSSRGNRTFRPSTVKTNTSRSPSSTARGHYSKLWTDHTRKTHSGRNDDPWHRFGSSLAYPQYEVSPVVSPRSLNNLHPGTIASRGSIIVNAQWVSRLAPSSPGRPSTSRSTQSLSVTAPKEKAGPQEKSDHDRRHDLPQTLAEGATSRVGKAAKETEQRDPNATIPPLPTESYLQFIPSILAANPPIAARRLKTTACFVCTRFCCQSYVDSPSRHDDSVSRLAPSTYTPIEHSDKQLSLPLTPCIMPMPTISSVSVPRKLAAAASRKLRKGILEGGAMIHGALEGRNNTSLMPYDPQQLAPAKLIARWKRQSTKSVESRGGILSGHVPLGLPHPDSMTSETGSQMHEYEDSIARAVVRHAIDAAVSTIQARVSESV